MRVTRLERRECRFQVPVITASIEWLQSEAEINSAFVVVVVGVDRDRSSLTERYQSLYADLIRALASSRFKDLRVACASLAGIVDIVYDGDEEVKKVVWRCGQQRAHDWLAGSFRTPPNVRQTFLFWSTAFLCFYSSFFFVARRFS